MPANLRGIPNEGVAVPSDANDAQVSLTVRVPRELRQRLRVFAAQRGVSVQQCTVEAVKAWLERQEESQDRVAP